MIQLYAHINDLVGCELYEWTKNDKHCYQHYRKPPQIPNIILPSVKDKGILYSLKVQPDAKIAHGNERYCVAKKIGITYLPIDVNFLYGLYDDIGNITLRKGVKLPNHTQIWTKQLARAPRGNIMADCSRLYGRGKTAYADPPELIYYTKI